MKGKEFKEFGIFGRRDPNPISRHFIGGGAISRTEIDPLPKSAARLRSRRALELLRKVLPIITPILQL